MFQEAAGETARKMTEETVRETVREALVPELAVAEPGLRERVAGQQERVAGQAAVVGGRIRPRPKWPSNKLQPAARRWSAKARVRPVA